ncbi:MAG: AAA family ATPase [Saprospiraceae bacterium]|nr:AAA family ATPase [Saprospiraceae bacterium]MBK8369970.1 AAA family ATPase [Saprospiraceae bacterium]MBK8548345.1 AAA family ATPase [Saprospiraceae bacterium]
MARKFRNIYVAATSQHVGKTTSTLGLVSSFMNRGYSVGYCKPVGQKFLNVQNLRVDKDTVLFADLINFNIVPELHSPVLLGPGATEMYLDNPDTFKLPEMILSAAASLESVNEINVFEGTGHPGVGSVANLSNARVAKILNAGVVMIVEGGIGSTIDMLNMTTSLFREEKVPIIGVIINKVIPEKKEKVIYYVGKWLGQQNLPLLGVLPYEKTLAYPVIKTVSEAISGVITYNADYANNRVESILAGSLIDLKELKSSQDLLLVVATRSINDAIKKIESMARQHGIKNCPLSGIVATGDGKIEKHTLEYIEVNKIPLIRSELDTYGAVISISKIEVKINTSTPWKVQMAIDLIQNNVDLEAILNFSKLA